MIPSAIVAWSRVDQPARFAAGVRRSLGRPGKVELYFAFDDPCSAVAVIDLEERLRPRHVTLELLPVVRRGIRDDPAIEQKRAYALMDARRLARRTRLGRLAREEPIDPALTAYLAEWVAAADQGPGLTQFCIDALRRLWFDAGADVEASDLEQLWERHLGSPPREDAAAVRRNERRMRRRGPYDTPAAYLHGHWYFAHDRLVQIGERLDELGWEDGRSPSGYKRPEADGHDQDAGLDAPRR